MWRVRNNTAFIWEGRKFNIIELGISSQLTRTISLWIITYDQPPSSQLRINLNYMCLGHASFVAWFRAWDRWPLPWMQNQQASESKFEILINSFEVRRINSPADIKRSFMAYGRLVFAMFVMLGANNNSWKSPRNSWYSRILLQRYFKT